MQTSPWRHAGGFVVSGFMLYAGSMDYTTAALVCFALAAIIVTYYMVKDNRAEKKAAAYARARAAHPAGKGLTRG